MKYGDILELHEYFQPAYDITDEQGDYWQQFITNEKFFKVLNECLNSVDGFTPSEKMSLWIQGSYGTGKSHATGVIRHILSDDLKKIENYIGSFGDKKILSKLRNYRSKGKVFSCVMKGTENINDNISFSAAIQRSIKESLRKEKIEILVKSDFEKIIDIIQKQTYIDWEKFIEDNRDIYMYVKNKEELIAKLKMGDLELLRNLQKKFEKQDIIFHQEKITVWLEEVAKEIRKRNIATDIIIFWDEFTSILELKQSSTFLSILQDISELSMSGKHIFLFLVSHRKPHQANLTNEDIEKILGRFKSLEYSMEPITTYHIVGAAIKKKDRKKWEEIRDNFYTDDIDDLIWKISGDEGTSIKNMIRDLFPIHPYTAYLSTFIVRNIGSTERSIFKFLYDEDFGFLSFIKNNPDKGIGRYLTVNYLWDFFKDEFERKGYELFSIILERYKAYKDTVESKSKDFLVIFKGILLLNILYKYVEEHSAPLIIPNKENIKYLFIGTEYNNIVEEALSFIDSKQIIIKTPDDKYWISSASFSSKELESIKNDKKKEILKVNNLLTTKEINNLKDLLIGNVLRATEFELFDANINEHLLKGKLNNCFYKKYTLKFALFLGITEQSITVAKKILPKLSKEDDYENIIFILIDRPFGEDNYDKFIEYSARVFLSEKHNFDEEKINNNKSLNLLIEKWFSQIEESHIEWFLSSSSGKEVSSRFYQKVNNEISNKIFKYGMENIQTLQNNINIWVYKNSKQAAELFLKQNTRTQLEIDTKSGIVSNLRNIIKSSDGDYIVEENLKIKSVYESHPTVKIYNEIKKIVEKRIKSGDLNFNIGELLIALSDAPFGLYRNMVNISAFAFAMREYIMKFYTQGSGQPIEINLMCDLIQNIFIYWEDEKDNPDLVIRYGSKDEKLLIDILKEIFQLKKENIGSLNQARWSIRDKINKVGYPIWLLKTSDNISPKTLDALDRIFFLTKSIDKDITQKEIVESLEALQDMEYELKQIINNDLTEELFIKWIAENIRSSFIDIKKVYTELVTFINEHMQEEVASWEETEVKRKIDEWQLELYRKKEDEDIIELIGHEGEKTKSTKKAILNKREEVLKQMNEFEGDFKSILISIIEQFDEVLEFIERKLNIHND